MRHTVDKDRLVFLDLETMGLLPTSPIVQVGLVVTRRDGSRMESLDELELVVPRSEVEWSAAQDVAAAMHAASGLRQRSIDEYELRRRPQGGPPSLHEVSSQTINFLAAQGFGPGEAVIAGNSVGMDRVWIATQMPHLHAYLHHRMVDVSAFSTVAAMFRSESARSAKAHTAVADCHAAISEFNEHLSLFAAWA